MHRVIHARPWLASCVVCMQSSRDVSKDWGAFWLPGRHECPFRRISELLSPQQHPWQHPSKLEAVPGEGGRRARGGLRATCPPPRPHPVSCGSAWGPAWGQGLGDRGGMLPAPRCCMISAWEAWGLQPRPAQHAGQAPLSWPSLARAAGRLWGPLPPGSTPARPSWRGAAQESR